MYEIDKSWKDLLYEGGSVEVSRWKDGSHTITIHGKGSIFHVTVYPDERGASPGQRFDNIQQLKYFGLVRQFDVDRVRTAFTGLEDDLDTDFILKALERRQREDSGKEEILWRKEEILWPKFKKLYNKELIAGRKW